MKNEFNKDEPVIIADENGNPVPVYRRDVDGVHVADRTTGKGRTVVTLKKSERHPDGATLYSSQDIEDVIAVLNGEPTAEMREQWQREIVAARRQRAEHDLGVKTRERDETVERAVAEEAQKVSDYAKAHFGRTQFLENVAKTVEASLSLRVSRALVRAGDRLREGSVQSFAVDKAAQFFGGKTHSLIVLAHEKADEPEQLREKMDSGLRTMEQRKVDEERRYNYEISALRVAAQEPNMREEDRERLRGIVREYRAGHADPDFRFVRDTRVNHYRNEKDIERGRQEAKRGALHPRDYPSIGERADRWNEPSVQPNRSPELKVAREDCWNAGLKHTAENTPDPDRKRSRNRDRGYDRDR